jgi:hypothetical protein
LLSSIFGDAIFGDAQSGDVMDQQLTTWKSAIERFWSVATPDYREVARLAAEIAAASTDDTLQQAAAQALPSLRNASLGSADRRAREVAHRRLSVIRDILHTLTAPRFGKRGIAPRTLTPEEHYRQMLGLPLGRRLAAAEIHQAYKHAAKTMHPDGGGNEREFRELSAARDALMKQQ